MTGDDDLREIFAGLGPITIKRMFGGEGVHHPRLFTAVETGGGLLLKTDAATAPQLAAAGATPNLVPRPQSDASLDQGWPG